jgi:hypothetical protein
MARAIARAILGPKSRASSNKSEKPNPTTANASSNEIEKLIPKKLKGSSNNSSEKPIPTTATSQFQQQRKSNSNDSKKPVPAKVKS